MNYRTFLVCLVLLISLSISVWAEDAIILKQEAAPIEITEYTTKYGTYERSRVIAHSVKYKNINEMKIVSIRLGFISFSAFNEFLNKFTGFSVEEITPNSERKGMWTDRHPRGFLFQTYGTGIAYVDAVRFRDGTIWKVNQADILPQIQEIEESFTAELLKEKEEIR